MCCWRGYVSCLLLTTIVPLQSCEMREDVVPLLCFFSFSDLRVIWLYGVSRKRVCLHKWWWGTDGSRREGERERDTLLLGHGTRTVWERKGPRPRKTKTCLGVEVAIGKFRYKMLRSFYGVFRTHSSSCTCLGQTCSRSSCQRVKYELCCLVLGGERQQSCTILLHKSSPDYFIQKC